MSSKEKGVNQRQLDLLKSSDLSDFKIKCQNKTFHVHKFILAAHSDYFRASFKLEWSAEPKECDHFTDEDPVIMALVLWFIYGSDYPDGHDYYKPCQKIVTLSVKRRKTQEEIEDESVSRQNDSFDEIGTFQPIPDDLKTAPWLLNLQVYLLADKLLLLELKSRAYERLRQGLADTSSGQYRLEFSQFVAAIDMFFHYEGFHDLKQLFAFKLHVMLKRRTWVGAEVSTQLQNNSTLSHELFKITAIVNARIVCRKCRHTARVFRMIDCECALQGLCSTTCGRRTFRSLPCPDQAKHDSMPDGTEGFEIAMGERAFGAPQMFWISGKVKFAEDINAEEWRKEPDVTNGNKPATVSDN